MGANPAVIDGIGKIQVAVEFAIEALRLRKHLLMPLMMLKHH